MLKRVEGLISSLDERVAQQLERFDTHLAGSRPELGSYSDDELRATLGALLTRLDRPAVSPHAGLDTLQIPGVRAAGTATKACLCGIRGSRDAATAAAPVTRPRSFDA